ncbi:MAG: Antibiotic biosynthesis monooxygenase [Chloroflexota bacterium]|jgi:heme-degrading monooxygenase HmoA|nr:Antibiotic biosynthesis monooxygenase [Chloroflexota bacterium]
MIVRMIHVQVAPEQIETARKVWKEHCAPLMIGTKGCLSEELLSCREVVGEMISMATWESQEDVDMYRESPAHEEIQRFTREMLKGARAVVKTYDIVP